MEERAAEQMNKSGEKGQDGAGWMEEGGLTGLCRPPPFSPSPPLDDQHTDSQAP